MEKNKPLPRDHSLHHASKELIAAENFHQKLLKHQHADFNTFEACWREFLQKIERAWNKTQAGMSTQPRWKRLEGEIEHLRKTDPLLRYLRHARNADEHSIQDMASDWNANLRCSKIEPISLRFEWDPWDRPLLPVTNRGITYQPPNEHLGVPVRDDLRKGIAEPILVAELALNFYKSVLDRAIVEVLKPSDV